LNKLANNDVNGFKDIAGIAYRTGVDAFVNNPIVFESDIDTFGMPQWDMIEPSSYSMPYQFFFRRFPIGYILLTRGAHTGARTAWRHTRTEPGYGNEAWT